MAAGGVLRRRPDSARQRQPLRRTLRPCRSPRSELALLARRRGSTGPRSIRRSSARSSNAASIRQSARSSAPTTPRARTSRRWSSRSSWRRCGASGRKPKTLIDRLLATGSKSPDAQPQENLRPARAQEGAERRRRSSRCASSTGWSPSKVLDPACGSGNFLYVTLRKLKDLESAVYDFMLEHGLQSAAPRRRRPLAALRHRDQPVRPRARPDDRLDRLPPVAAPPERNSARSSLEPQGVRRLHLGRIHYYLSTWSSRPRIESRFWRSGTPAAARCLLF